MRVALVFLLASILVTPAFSQSQTAGNNNWISASNDFTSMVLKVEMKHNPETGSRQGLAEYDELVSQPTLADEDQERKEGQAEGRAPAAEAERSGAGSGDHYSARRTELPHAGLSARA